MTNSSRLTHPPTYHPRLHRFAFSTVIVCFILIASGGNVTSHGAGLAVPDWPTTFEYNMFTYPLQFWTGGVFHEHLHRLKGSLVGLMTIVLTVWLWRTQKYRPWLRYVGILLLGLVIIQGLLGGFRVIFATGDFSGVGGDVSAQRIKEPLATMLAVIHGILGQLFLCLLVFTSAATSHWWSARDQVAASPASPRLVWPQSSLPESVPTPAKLIAIAFLLAVIGQLALGAAVRHTKSALAVPDFPLNYGGIAPPITQVDLDRAISQMSNQYFEDRYRTGMVLDHYTVAQVWLAYGHRVWAMLVLVMGLMLVVQVGRLYGRQPLVSRPVLALLVMLVLQLLLGALVIWSLRFPYISTMHQALGAAILAVAFLIYLRICRIPPQWELKQKPLSTAIQPDRGNMPMISDSRAAVL